MNGLIGVFCRRCGGRQEFQWFAWKANICLRFGRRRSGGLVRWSVPFGGGMRFNVSLLRFLSFSLFLTFSGITARAQSDRGTIAGTVLDSSGGVVANVAVTVTSRETGANYGAITGPTGGFRIQDVRVGTYDVSASAPGFSIEKKTCAVIQVNSTASLEFSLQAGNVTETLTVVADAPAIQTETSEIGTVVGTRQIEELPLALNGTGQSHLRSVESFVFLTPVT